MSTKNLIERILEPHKINLELSFFGITTEVAVDIPDLRDSRRKVWGDWGPMFAIDLDPYHPIVATVKTSGSNEIKQLILDVSTVEVCSPILACTRAKAPLYLTLPIASEDLNLEVYYDKEGDPRWAELTPMKPASSHARPKLVRVA